MASNMQRQAVPLLEPETPIVGTGYERVVAVSYTHLDVYKRQAYYCLIIYGGVRVETFTKI